MINSRNAPRSVRNDSPRCADEASEKGKHMIRRKNKRKTVWAYKDGEKLVDVVQAALDNNMMVDDLKQALIQENPVHEITFKVE